MNVIFKLSLLIGIAVLFFFLPNSFASEVDFMNSTSFKVTILQDGVEYEWEYYNPDEYEWEHGNTVEKKEIAKQKVTELYKKLKVKESTKVDDIVNILKNSGFEDMEHLDVRWINKEGKLYTWVWDQAHS